MANAESSNKRSLVKSRPVVGVGSFRLRSDHFFVKYLYKLLDLNKYLFVLK